MASLDNSQSLSIVIPSLNEASNLPLLLADLNRWPYQLEICVCDACSTDLTSLVAELAGAKLVQLPEPNRGAQLHQGAISTKGDWILFLHADCRLPENWTETLEAIINKPSSERIAWFFDFKVEGKSTALWLLELAINIRCNLLKKPYGDQGLLLNRAIYNYIGGYRPLYLMEDLDLIERLSKIVRIKSIGIPLYCSSRRWHNINLLSNAYKNAQLRRRWRRGESTKDLAKNYYTNCE